MHRGATHLAATLIAVAGGATPALAHPHVFIDTGVEVIFDGEGLASALRITWTYDEMYSLVILEDRGLDSDYDGVLTEAETATISGFDMNWDAGYAGDSYALIDEAPIVLGPPQDWTADLTEGRLVSTHLRPLLPAVPVGADPLVVQSYDPSFYVAYRIVGTPLLTGRSDCTVQVFEPDLAAADSFLQQALDEMYGTADLEADFPAVGAAYADEARVTCAAPS
jgi:polyphosphate kinase